MCATNRAGLVDAPRAAVPTRRVYARRLVERVDLDPRVVGDGRQSGLLVVVERLEPRVLGERRAGFFGLREVRKLLECDQLPRRVRKDSADLAQLSCVGGGY
jgi:hypothetical protein